MKPICPFIEAFIYSFIYPIHVRKWKALWTAEIIINLGKQPKLNCQRVANQKRNLRGHGSESPPPNLANFPFRRVKTTVQNIFARQLTEPWAIWSTTVTTKRSQTKFLQSKRLKPLPQIMLKWRPCTQHYIHRIYTQVNLFLDACTLIKGWGGVVVRAHDSCAEGLRFEPDSMPRPNTRSLFTQQQMGHPVGTLGR